MSDNSKFKGEGELLERAPRQSGDGRNRKKYHFKVRLTVQN